MTATFSVFAYLWLFIILVLISPDVIEVWEALLTFLFFPILVALAYAADNNFFRPQPRDKTQVDKSTGMLYYRIMYTCVHTQV